MSPRQFRIGIAALMASFAALTFGAEIPQPSPQMKPAQAPTVAKPAVPPPVRVVRTPLPTLPLRPLTNRVLLPSAIADLIARSKSQLRQPLPGPPGKRALVVILENGGIMNNVEPGLRNALNVNVPTASCGTWEFYMLPGESMPSFLARVAGDVGGNLQCINPASWQIGSVNLLGWLDDQTDKALEDSVTGANSLLNTQSYYDVVAVMQDANAVPDNVVAMIRSLAPTHMIDVHVLTHGGFDTFYGYKKAAFNQVSFFKPLTDDRNAGWLYLRAVYQMNCFSATLKDEWIKAGAVAVNGTQEPTLNNMPHQYFHFMTRWLIGKQGMVDASQGSFNDASVYTAPVYGLVGMAGAVSPSRLTVAGDENRLNINVLSAL